MSLDEKALVLPAAAKINLYLDVLGVRENGYHDIRSIVMPVDLCDLVKLECTPETIETVIRMDGDDTAREFAPRPGLGWQDSGLCSKKNIATRAARALQEETGHRGGVRIAIQKRIPIGGGLGGGSADAAVVLKGLNILWKTGLPTSRLLEIGAGLGCDVPALIHGGAVLVEGLGERVQPLDVPCKGNDAGWWLVILNPGIRVSTQDIYTRCHGFLTSCDGKYKEMVSALRAGDVGLAGSSLFNGLQETVFRKYPLIRMMAEELAHAGALGVLVSGSGASVFGLARDEGHARRVEQNVRDAAGYEVWSWVTKTLPDGVTAAHGPLEARV